MGFRIWEGLRYIHDNIFWMGIRGLLYGKLRFCVKNIMMRDTINYSIMKLYRLLIVWVGLIYDICY